MISANAEAGLLLEGANAQAIRVRNNFIGTDVAGTAPLGNGGDGVHLRSGASHNTIGFTMSPGRNVISANLQHGVHLEHEGTVSNLVESNFIGTDLTGTNALGNHGSGVRTSRGASQNTMGGSSGGNTIAFNQEHGVHLRDGTQNLIRNNAIFANGGLGINLGLDDEVTPNDVGDADTGANELQNVPVLHSAVADTNGTVLLTGTLASLPITSFTLEFFVNDTCDPSGFGEGAATLGLTNVMTDSGGAADFTLTFPTGVAIGQYVTATATDPFLNTSEFSACAPVVPADGAPRLAIANSETALIISWAEATGYQLYWATNLSQPILWHVATNTVQSLNGTNAVSIESKAGNRFFRLCNP